MIGYKIQKLGLYRILGSGQILTENRISGYQQLLWASKVNFFFFYLKILKYFQLRRSTTYNLPKIKINRKFAILKIEMLYWKKNRLSGRISGIRLQPDIRPDIWIRLFYNRIIRNPDPASKSLSGTALSLIVFT